MSLEDKLAAIREGAARRIPDGKRAVMGAATRALRASGIMDGVAKPGDALPPFALANRAGAIVHSADLLGRGPLVVTIFRGSW